MKINIINDSSKTIANYKNLVLTSNTNFTHIVDNSCEEILCVDALDYVDQNSRNAVLGSILSKLRLNGRIIIAGTDVRSLSRLVLSENISVDEYNKEIENKKSLSTSTNIRNILLSSNLKIESELIRGQKYELTAIRK